MNLYGIVLRKVAGIPVLLLWDTVRSERGEGVSLGSPVIPSSGGKILGERRYFDER